MLRGGWGVNYQFAASQGGAIVSTNGTYPLAGVNPYVNIQTPGSIVAPAWPITNPNRYPVLGTVGGTPGSFAPDQNQLRPPRVNQWSIGIQREITNSLLVDASYVANRGVWEPGGPLGFLSQISPAKFAKYGLYPYPGTGPAGYSYAPAGVTCVPGNDCDRALLNLPITNPAVVAKMASAGIANISPYPGFAGTTLLSALYPYPQFGNLAPTGSATGNSKYDSLQIKLTKRFSRGLQANGAYTWAKGLTRPIPQDFFNSAGSRWTLQQIPPQALTFNVTYTTPRAAFLPKWANVLVKDWQVGFFAQYQSGIFLTPPVSPTANFLLSEDVRVPGQPLYLVSINDIHSYNPQSQVVLNPKAWSPCPTNTTCGSAANTIFGPAGTQLYPDFRGPRTPRENANLGRHFRIKERMDLYIRAEFVNIFNRTIFPNPTTTNPQLAPIHGAGGGTILTSGFGVINAYNAPGTAPPVSAGAVTLLGRTGTLIARFSF